MCYFSSPFVPTYDMFSQENDSNDSKISYSAEEPEEVSNERNLFIFFDNSNIWIVGQDILNEKEKERIENTGGAAKSLQHDHEISEDSPIDEMDEDYYLNLHFRLDVGAILKKVTHNRHLKRGLLVGSKPLPTDTYWKASKRAGWEVITHERNPYNGREKKVDGTIIAQATLCAALEKDPIIAILSGDGDYAPVIQAVSTLNKNISIEIWSWDRSLSRCYRQYEKDYSFVKTYSLDEHFNEITFIAQEFKSPVANIPRERTLVAVGLDGHPQMKEFMRNYPRVQYTNFGSDKVIIFPENQVSGKFDDFFTEAKSFFSDAQDNIISYVEYSNRTNAPSSSTLSVSNPFEVLDELDDDETERLEEKIAEDAEETKWETINRPKRLIEEKKNKKCQRCWKGLFCRKFATRGCEYTHPPTIVEFQRKGAKMRKYQLCKQGNNCKFAAVPWKCEFLHPGEVRLCLWCNKQHNTSICF